MKTNCQVRQEKLRHLLLAGRPWLPDAEFYRLCHIYRNANPALQRVTDGL